MLKAIWCRLSANIDWARRLIDPLTIFWSFLSEIFHWKWSMSQPIAWHGPSASPESVYASLLSIASLNNWKANLGLTRLDWASHYTIKCSCVTYMFRLSRISNLLAIATKWIIDSISFRFDLFTFRFATFYIRPLTLSRSMGSSTAFDLVASKYLSAAML